MNSIRTYQLFYTFYRDDGSVAEEVPHTASKTVDLATVYSEILGRLLRDRDFFGLIDDQGTTFQVMYEAKDDKYWCEIPWPPLRGSYGARLTFDQITDLLKALPSWFKLSAFPSFELERW